MKKIGIMVSILIYAALVAASNTFYLAPPDSSSISDSLLADLQKQAHDERSLMIAELMYLREHEGEEVVDEQRLSQLLLMNNWKNVAKTRNYAVKKTLSTTSFEKLLNEPARVLHAIRKKRAMNVAEAADIMILLLQNNAQSIDEVIAIEFARIRVRLEARDRITSEIESKIRADINTPGYWSKVGAQLNFKVPRFGLEIADLFISANLAIGRRDISIEQRLSIYETYVATRKKPASDVDAALMFLDRLKALGEDRLWVMSAYVRGNEKAYAAFWKSAAEKFGYGGSSWRTPLNTIITNVTDSMPELQEQRRRPRSAQEVAAVIDEIKAGIIANHKLSNLDFPRTSHHSISVLNTNFVKSSL